MVTARSLLLGLAIYTSAPFMGGAQLPAVQELYKKAQADQRSGNEAQAVADYQQLLKLDPSVAAAYNNLGRLLYNLGRYDEAIATLRQGLALAPEMVPARIMLGAALFQQGHMEDALSPLQTGVQALPEDRFARVTLARVFIALKRPDDAVLQLNAVLLSHPKDQEAWYVLGKLHLQLSQEAFTQVAALDANSPLAHELAGEIMESMQNTPGAVDAYKQALAAAPGNVGALEHLSNLYWSTGDWVHARDTLTELIAKQPATCVAHWKLGNTLDELGEDAAKGMTEVERSLALCPDLPQAHAERARLLLRMGKPAAALPDLEVAERAAPDEPSVQRLLSQAYRALGDRTRADAANQRFQQLEAAEHAAKEKHAADVIQSNR